MKTIVKKVVKLETKRHDFDNDFAYIEVWRNNSLTDCYFVEKQYLWPDGSIKRGGVKYFHSSLHGDEIEKEIRPINLEKFNWFNRLFYLDGDGTVHQIDCDDAKISPSSNDEGEN